MAKNVVIVGAGLFGGIAARLCRQAGHSVTVIDSREPWAASKASGCVLAPSWLSSLDSATVDTSMKVLAELATVHDVAFKTNLGATFKAKRVDPRDLLVEPDITEPVVSVGDGVVNMGGGGGKIRGKVLVAAGIGSPLLVPGMPSVRGLWGASLLAKGKMKESRIHVYAPYRQAVAFQMDPEFVWMGDGTALVQKTWAKEEQTRIKSTLQRATDLFGIKGAKNGQVNIGARPYVEGHKSGYFERVHPNTWVSTGGAKSGTVLAAYFAYLFVKALK